MYILAWLWNPWDKYIKNRHNIGFIILDKICNYYNWSEFVLNSKFNTEISSFEINNKKFLAIKPMSFMNLSWNWISQILNFYKLNSNNLIVIYDDIDLEVWKIRYRNEWSNWWHNWVWDIIAKIWTNKFSRIKIWIWRPLNKEQVANYVLSNFKDEELNNILLKFDEIIKYINNLN